MNRSLELRISFQIFSKVFFAFYIVYSNVLSFSLFTIRGLSTALLACAVMLQLLHDKFRLHFDKSFIALLLFALYAYVSGFLVAYDFDKALSTLLSFVEYLVVFYLVICYISSDGKPDFSMVVFILQALLTIFFMVFRGVGITRISISNVVNVNTIGTTLAFAIGFVLYLLIARRNKPINWVIGIASIAALLVGILLTVSKKAIIGGAALIVLWIVLCYRSMFARIRLIWKLLILLGFVVTGVYVYRWFMSQYAFQIEVLLYRMDNLYVGDSDQARIYYIKEGFRIFLSHPIFGVGLNNARYYNMLKETYTHCLYSELPACTGIIGTFIFGYTLVRPWVIISEKRKSYKRTDPILNTRNKYLLAIFVVFLAINFTQIAFYAQNLMYVLAIITGFAVSAPLMNGQEQEVLNEKGSFAG